MENIEWNLKMDETSSKLKSKLMEKLIRSDYPKEFIIQTDASYKGIGVIMTHEKK